MTETPHSINEWAVDTFGVHSPLDCAIRGNREVSELLSALSNNAEPSVILDEIADVTVMFWQTVEKFNAMNNLDTVFPDRRRGPRTGYTDLDIGLELTSTWNLLMRNLSGGYLNRAVIADLQDDLSLLASRFGSVLQTEVDRKMVINRNRTWKKNEHGSFQHV